jgi:predicted O-linked N-acetylglucosamine transferase (SPINDLY family)
MKKKEIEKNFNKGVLQLNDKFYREAIASFSRCISLGQKVPEVYSNRGMACHEIGLYAEAIKDYDKAIKINPDYVEALSNLAVTYNRLKRFKDASIKLKRVIALRPSFATAYINLGISLHNLSRFDEAIKQYDLALQINPNNAITHMQRGITLVALKKYADAFDSYDKAISLNPNYVEAYLNAGIAFTAVNMSKEALALYNQAIIIDPSIARLYSLKSNILFKLNYYEESIECLYDALKIDSNNIGALGNLLLRKNYLYDWRNYYILIDKLQDKIKKNIRVAEAFSCLSLFNDASVLKKVAALEVCDHSQRSPLKKYAHHEKIRLGFFSSDFQDHPIAHLATEFFEKIDRSRFEVTAFSFGSAKGHDPFRARLMKAFDRFVDAKDKNDLDVVQESRGLEIDIAIDLNGLTAGCRTEVFALRAAPVQVQWLGFLGTMGAEFIDYIIADKTLIPEEERVNFTEKIVYVPAYQPNIVNREISSKEFYRSDFGLSDSQFVFCCFNGSYKVLPYIFDSWMNILKETPGSVLWLAEENETAQLNIKKETLDRGVDPSRVVFAKKIPIPEYLARFSLADLFLDTFPYSAGTIASDALRMGLPLIALQGRTFSSRMSSSCLHAVNMPELVTNSASEYERLAIELCNDKIKHVEIKEKLKSGLAGSKLFDIERTTKYIESAFEVIYDRSQREMPSEHIFIGS